MMKFMKWKKCYFETFRLGDFRKNIVESEPFLGIQI